CSGNRDSAAAVVAPIGPVAPAVVAPFGLLGPAVEDSVRRGSAPAPARAGRLGPGRVRRTVRVLRRTVRVLRQIYRSVPREASMTWRPPPVWSGEASPSSSLCWSLRVRL